MAEIFTFILGVIVGVLLKHFVYIGEPKQTESEDSESDEIEEPLVP